MANSSRVLEVFLGLVEQALTGVLMVCSDLIVLWRLTGGSQDPQWCTSILELILSLLNGEDEELPSCCSRADRCVTSPRQVLSEARRC